MQKRELRKLKQLL